MLSTNVILLAIVMIGLIYLYYNKNFREGACTMAPGWRDKMNAWAKMAQDPTAFPPQQGGKTGTFVATYPNCFTQSVNVIKPLIGFVQQNIEKGITTNAATACPSQTDKASCTNALPWGDTGATGTCTWQSCGGGKVVTNQSNFQAWWDQGGSPQCTYKSIGANQGYSSDSQCQYPNVCCNPSNAGSNSIGCCSLGGLSGAGASPAQYCAKNVIADACVWTEPQPPDCAGTPGGSAKKDACGVCNGSGIAAGKCDCAGNVNDCAGNCGGSAKTDACGKCGGSGIAPGKCDCAGNVNDCAGNCGGSAKTDACGKCGGDGSTCACPALPGPACSTSPQVSPCYNYMTNKKEGAACPVGSCGEGFCWTKTTIAAKCPPTPTPACTTPPQVGTCYTQLLQGGHPCPAGATSCGESVCWTKTTTPAATCKDAANACAPPNYQPANNVPTDTPCNPAVPLKPAANVPSACKATCCTINYSCTANICEAGSGYFPSSSASGCGENQCVDNDSQCCDAQLLCSTKTCSTADGETRPKTVTDSTPCTDKTCANCCQVLPFCSADKCASKELADGIVEGKTLCASINDCQTNCCKPLGKCNDENNPLIGTGALCVGTWLPDPTKSGGMCEAAKCKPDECCMGDAKCAPEVCQTSDQKWYWQAPPPSTSCGHPAPCKPEECCQQSAICETSVCTGGQPSNAWTWNKEKSGKYCGAATCEEMECCNSTAKCANFKCIGKYTPSTNAKEFCTTTECTTTECCEPTAACATTFKTDQDCGTNYHLKSNPAPYCTKGPGGSCSPAECCDPNPFCPSNICPGEDESEGWSFRGDNQQCAGATCTKADCCVQEGQCSNYSCPEQYHTKVLAPKYCTGAGGATDNDPARYCTTEQCCDLNARCSDDLCGVGYQLKQTIPKTCAGITCQRHECCDALGSCADFSCEPGTSAKLMQSQFCRGSMCENNECCISNPTCKDFDCGTDWHEKIINAITTCQSRQCTRGECCSQNATCGNAYNCPTGYHLANPDTICEGENCTDSECCIKNETCGSFICPKGRQLKDNFDQVTCQESICTDTECCEPIPTPYCTSSFVCPTNSYLKSNIAEIKCAGPACTDTECCNRTAKPTCVGSNMQCPAYYTLKATANNITCADYTCTTEECCDPNASCDLFQCPAGYKTLEGNIICNEGQCTISDCCQKNETCVSMMCGDGFLKKSNSIVCAGETCEFDECCIEKPLPPKPPLKPNVDKTWTRNYFGGTKVFKLPQ